MSALLANWTAAAVRTAAAAGIKTVNVEALEVPPHVIPLIGTGVHPLGAGVVTVT